MNSCLNLERAKADRLQDGMDEDRRRYEQRLSLVMSNPSVRNRGAHSVDVASKVEMQRLKQELVAAQNTLVVPHQTHGQIGVENERMMGETRK